MMAARKGLEFIHVELNDGPGSGVPAGDPSGGAFIRCAEHDHAAQSPVRADKS